MDIKSFIKNLISRKSILFTLIILIVYTVIGGAFSTALLFIGILFIVAFLVISSVILLKDKKRAGLTGETGMISNITLDFVMGFSSPVVIINDSGLISWYNRAFLAIAETNSSLYGKNITELIGENNPQVRPEQLGAGITVSIKYNEVDYDITGYKLTSAGRNYIMTVWDDNTELNMAKQLLSDSSIVVAFVMVDMISEMQYIQDKYRTVSAHVASLLDDWCSSFGGIIKEYEKDKYIILFEQKHYKDVIATKFEILDSIRKINVDDIALHLTASIGVAMIGGTLAEKEKAARQALDLALQRGGDQAVVKTDSSLEYYGGMTKAVQKRSKIRSKAFANDLMNHMKNSSNIIIMGHKYIDHDAIASSIAVARIAQCCGKTAKIAVNIHDPNLKPVFSKLRGYSNYDEIFVDAVSAQDLIRSDTLLVICDVNNPVHFEAPEIFNNCSKVVIIDHHRKTGEYLQQPVLSYIEPAASSTSEVMCDLLEQALGTEKLNKVEADILLAGIMLDTSNFSKNTSTNTFSAANYLCSAGASPDEAKKMFKTDINSFLAEVKFESNIIIYKERVAIAAQKGEHTVEDKIAAAKAADKLLNIEGVDASFVVCSINDTIHISARSSTNNFNVQLILEKFNGGGHFDAAAAVVENISMNEVLNQLKAEIDKHLIKN